MPVNGMRGLNDEDDENPNDCPPGMLSYSKAITIEIEAVAVAGCATLGLSNVRRRHPHQRAPLCLFARNVAQETK